jgi:hypothetical protein
MSEIRVNNITNREGSAGPSVAGIPVVDSNSHFVVPTGRTGQRYADNGENIVRDGLVLYLDAKYSYPGATGTNPDVYTWYDMSGNENHGELKNGVSYSGTDGGSLVFDGVNDYVKLDSFISGIENSFTVGLFVNRNGDGLNFPRFFLNARVNTSITITQYGITTGVLYRLTSGSTLYEYNLPSGTLVNNEWVYLSFSYDGATMRAYINGIEYGSGNSVNINVNTASSYHPFIGGDGVEVDDASISSFDGKISQVSIYNRALTAQEVLQNFNATRSRYGI